MDIHIYALIDPRDDATRYVGVTGQLANRIESHLSKWRTTAAVEEWITELAALGHEPYWIVLEHIPNVSRDDYYFSRGNNWLRDRERKWAMKLIIEGAPLLNREWPSLLPEIRRNLASYQATYAWHAALVAALEPTPF